MSNYAANHPTRESIGSSICAKPMPGWRSKGQSHGKAQAIGVAATARNEILIGSGKDVMPRQGVRITRHAKEQLAFFVGKQRSARH